MNKYLYVYRYMYIYLYIEDRSCRGPSGAPGGPPRAWGGPSESMTPCARERRVYRWNLTCEGLATISWVKLGCWSSSGAPGGLRAGGGASPTYP